MELEDYEVLEEIGRGGMGVVRRGRARDGTVVAIKILSRFAPPPAMDRFRRETRLHGQLGQTEGFVPLLASGQSPEGPYIVMPFLTGGTLRSRLASGSLPVAEAISLVRRLAQAIGRAHAGGVVHRDLKPENVLFDEAGRPLIADLGLAKHFRDDVPGASQTTTLSKLGELRGTLGYMPREQLRDAKCAEATADVFALGVILYECLAGRRPFHGEDIFEILEKLDAGDVEPVERLREETPSSAAAAIRRALERDPANRFADGAALAHALEDAELEARPAPSVATPSVAPGRTNRLAALSLSGVALLGLAAGLGVAFTTWRSRPELARDVQDAVRGSRDVPRLLRDMKELRERGARSESLAQLETYVIEAALEDAIRSPELETVESRVELIENLRRRATPEQLDRARLALVIARARAYAKGIARVTLASVTTPALEVAATLDLLGESSDGVAILDALAEAGASREGTSAVASSLAALAEARLRARDDAQGHALRACAALLAAGAPTRPLGPGRLGTIAAQSSAVTTDLERARELPGKPGARAAWLLVDLRLTARDRDDTALQSALEAAVRLAGDAGVRSDLERLAGLESTPANWKALRDEIGKDPVRGCLRLSRFLARAGAPSALDHAELAEADLALVRRTIARESLAAYAPIPPSAASLEDAVRVSLEGACDVRAEIEQEADHEVIRQRFRSDLGRRLDALLAAGLARAPDDGALASVASDPSRGFFSAPALLLLALRGAVRETYGFQECYNFADREALRANPTSVRSWEPAWEFDNKRGLAAVAEFERSVRRDTLEDGDPVVKVARDHGLDPRLCEDAVDASTGLKALEELTPCPPRDLSFPLDEGERPALELRAARGLEALGRLGGATVLARRARWRRLALPSPWGQTLAAVDLVRAVELGRSEPPEPRGEWAPTPAWPLLDAAMKAAELENGELRKDLAGELCRESLAWHAEAALRDSFHEGFLRDTSTGALVRVTPPVPRHTQQDRLAFTVSAVDQVIRNLSTENEALPLREAVPEAAEPFDEMRLGPDLVERAARPRYTPPASSALLGPAHPDSH
jgi:hypothetical protein